MTTINRPFPQSALFQLEFKLETAMQTSFSHYLVKSSHLNHVSVTFVTVITHAHQIWQAPTQFPPRWEPLERKHYTNFIFRSCIYARREQDESEKRQRRGKFNDIRLPNLINTRLQKRRFRNAVVYRMFETRSRLITEKSHYGTSM